MDLQSALHQQPFILAPLKMLFIGGPNDGRVEAVLSADLEYRAGGHAYKLALTKSDDPAVPYQYCLVSRTLVHTRPKLIVVPGDDS